MFKSDIRKFAREDMLFDEIKTKFTSLKNDKKKDKPAEKKPYDKKNSLNQIKYALQHPSAPKLKVTGKLNNTALFNTASKAKTVSKLSLESAKSILTRTKRDQAAKIRFTSPVSRMETTRRERTDLNSTIGSYTPSMTESTFSPKREITFLKPKITSKPSEKVDSTQMMYSDLLSDLSFKLRMKGN